MSVRLVLSVAEGKKKEKVRRKKQEGKSKKEV